MNICGIYCSTLQGFQTQNSLSSKHVIGSHMTLGSITFQKSKRDRKHTILLISIFTLYFFSLGCPMRKLTTMTVFKSITKMEYEIKEIQNDVGI